MITISKSSTTEWKCHPSHVNGHKGNQPDVWRGRTCTELHKPNLLQCFLHSKHVLIQIQLPYMNLYEVETSISTILLCMKNTIQYTLGICWILQYLMIIQTLIGLKLDLTYTPRITWHKYFRQTHIKLSLFQFTYINEVDLAKFKTGNVW